VRGGKTPIHIMRWAPADYVNDPFVRLLLAKEDFATLAIYHLALNWSHMEGGDLPADPEQLGAMLGIKRGRVERGLRLCVEAGKLEQRDGRLFHRRVVREVEKELAFRRDQSSRAKKRWEAHPPGQEDALAMPVHSQGSISPHSPPSPYAVAVSPAPEAVRHPADQHAPANPLVGDRPAKESELLALVRREAELTNRDGAEVMSEVTSYSGAKTSKLNPASMSDDRLLNSLLDAKARVKRLEAAQGVTHGGP